MDGIAAIEARVAEICRRFTPPAPPAAPAASGPASSPAGRGAFGAHLSRALGAAGGARAAAPGAPAAPTAGERAGRVDGWIAEAIARTGAPPSWAPALRTIAERESSLNPAAANVSASGGNPARTPVGLMQMLPSTFAAHAQQGHTDILDPVDNLAAAIRYIRSRYGDPASTPGLRALARGDRYVGY